MKRDSNETGIRSPNGLDFEWWGTVTTNPACPAPSKPEELTLDHEGGPTRDRIPKARADMNTMKARLGIE